MSDISTKSTSSSLPCCLLSNKLDFSSLERRLQVFPNLDYVMYFPADPIWRFPLNLYHFILHVLTDIDCRIDMFTTCFHRAHGNRSRWPTRKWSPHQLWHDTLPPENLLIHDKLCWQDNVLLPVRHGLPGTVHPAWNQGWCISTTGINTDLWNLGLGTIPA